MLAILPFVLCPNYLNGLDWNSVRKSLVILTKLFDKLTNIWNNNRLNCLHAIHDLFLFKVYDLQQEISMSTYLSMFYWDLFLNWKLCLGLFLGMLTNYLSIARNLASWSFSSSLLALCVRGLLMKQSPIAPYNLIVTNWPDLLQQSWHPYPRLPS